MDRWFGRVAVVTGASSGIGASVAEALARQGMIVIGCARRLDRLQALSDSLSDASGRFHPIQCDVSDESQILAMFDEVRSKFGGVDVCINNAGVSPPSAELLTGSTDSWKNMLDVNVLGLTICTREAYKSMRQRSVDDGQIINICSTAGHTVGPPPDGFFYSATKFAVRALTEGVRKELRAAKSHIRIAEISPGFVETEIVGHWRGEDGAKKFFSKNKCLQPKDIADSVVYILSTLQHVEVNDIIICPT